MFRTSFVLSMKIKENNDFQKHENLCMEVHLRLRSKALSRVSKITDESTYLIMLILQCI